MSAETQFQGLASQIENNANKVTSVNADSTDTQYPSAKCLYDAISALPTPEHGTWTPQFDPLFISSVDNCTATYTKMNDHEMYIYLFVIGTVGEAPTSSGANSTGGLPVVIGDNIIYTGINYIIGDGVVPNGTSPQTILFSGGSNGGFINFWPAEGSESIAFICEGVIEYA